MATDETARLAAERRGRSAERLARWSLWLSGWRVLAHQARGRRGSGVGEIDIIASQGRALAFIEVKARETSEAGLEAISADQRARIVRGAEAFVAAHPQYADFDMRFDVITVQPWRWPKRFADAWRP